MDDRVTLHHLLIYSHVAHAASFTAAARRMTLSQSIVSRTVADLERHLAAKLITRTSRVVSLTSEGREFLQIADEIIRAHQEGLQRFAHFRTGLRGTVQVAALPSLAAVLLPPIVAQFLSEFPDLHVRIRDDVSANVVDHVRRGRADIGVVDIDEPPADMIIYDLLEDDYVSLVHSSNPLAKMKRVSWRELAQYPFVTTMLGSGVRRITDQQLTAIGSSTVGAIETNSATTIGGMVNAGLGVSALPTLILPLAQFPKVVVLPLYAPVTTRRIGVIVSPSRELLPASRRFVRFLTNSVAEGQWKNETVRRPGDPGPGPTSQSEE